MLFNNTVLDISQYQSIKKIGEGGFSKVYLIQDKTTSDLYAAKVAKILIDEEEEYDSENVHVLFREISLISLLNHPSILRFIGYYSTNFKGDHCPTIISEFAVNGSLHDIIDMEMSSLSPDDWNDTKKLINIYGIAAGMSYLHFNNVIHRELKPGNIIMDEYLHPKISDFGL